MDDPSTYWRVDEIFPRRHSGAAAHVVDLETGNSRVAELNSVDLLSGQSGSEVWIPRLGVSKNNRAHCLLRAKESFDCRVGESCAE